MSKEAENYGRPTTPSERLFDTKNGELTLPASEQDRSLAEKAAKNALIMGKNAFRAISLFGKEAKENFGAAGETVRDATKEAKDNLAAARDAAMNIPTTESTEDPKDL